MATNRRHKIYGDPKGYQLGFNPGTGELDVTKLKVNTGVGGASGTSVTGAEIAVLASSGVTNADLVRLHAQTSTAAEANILTGATVTATELNTAADLSAQTETIAAAGAVSVLKRITKVALVGAGAITLAAPDATMLGYVKIIEMTADNGDVTMALTNVDGGSAATTCTFNDVGDALIVIAGVSKWHVLKEIGVGMA